MVGGVPLASFVVGTEKGRCTRDLMLTLSVNESADLALEDWAATYTGLTPVSLCHDWRRLGTAELFLASSVAGCCDGVGRHLCQSQVVFVSWA